MADIEDEDLNYYEPDEDNPELEEAEALETDNPDAETDEGPDEAGAEDAEESDAEEAEPSEEEAADGDDDVVVPLADGSQVKLAELKAGYQRQADYTRKTTEVAEERKAVEALRSETTERAQQAELMTQNLLKYVQENLIPPEPQLALARENPGEYQYQMALRQQAIAELGPVLQAQQQAASQQASYTEADVQRMKAAEDKSLIAVMPTLKDPASRAAFDDGVKKAAVDFGFSEDEISQTIDHRILQMAHYAAIGKRAEANQKAAGRRKAAPQQGARPRPAKSTGNTKNRQAMDRLKKSGSIGDAMSIDIDFG